jgi:ferritin-like metal-binding protein YciE
MRKQGKAGILAFQLKYGMQYVFYNNLYKLMNMATKHTGPSRPIEKISNTVYRSKNDHTPSSKESLKKIFEELLQDSFNAEEQLIKALLEFTKVTDNEDLEQLFNYHLSELINQSTRLSHVTYRLRIENQGTVCKAMQGLIHEAGEIIKKHPLGISRDAALIIALQKIQHYEIASYGSLIELADVLCLDHIADELERTLYEKKNLNELYLDIAQDINNAAYEGVPTEYELYA